MHIVLINLLLHFTQLTCMILMEYLNNKCLLLLCEHVSFHPHVSFNSTKRSFCWKHICIYCKCSLLYRNRYSTIRKLFLSVPILEIGGVIYWDWNHAVTLRDRNTFYLFSSLKVLIVEPTENLLKFGSTCCPASISHAINQNTINDCCSNFKKKSYNFKWSSYSSIVVELHRWIHSCHLHLTRLISSLLIGFYTPQIGHV